MNIVFRVDSSDIIGTGHVYRCLNLAYQYKNHNISFICKNHPYNLMSKISENYKVYQINLEIEDFKNINLDISSWLGESQEKDVLKTIEIIKLNKLEIDWLIIDHYGIDEIWENGIKSYVKKICVIDDYTDRKHNCNILLNQQISEKEGIELYKKIINNDCKLYCGNDYLLLHPKYFNYINFEKKFDDYIKRINIFMGGSDSHNITDKIINICNKYNNLIEKKILFDVIIGKSNKNYELIKDKINNLNYFNIYYDLEFIGDLIGESDLCIGAPGSTSYERCLMKIPSLCICIADNQKTIIKKLIKSGTINYLGTVNDDYEEKIINYLNYYNENMNELKKKSINCSKFINLKNNKIKYILL